MISPGAKPRRTKRLIWLAAVMLVYTIVGFFVLPAIIKSQMLKRLPALTKRQVAVGQVKVNPYTLSLTIRGLALTETNGEPFAGWDEFYINFQLSSIFHRAWVFKEISLTHPYAQVSRLQDGKFNFENLLGTNPPPAKPAAKSQLPAVIVENLSIDGASLAVADLTRSSPFHTKIAPINVHLTDFTTKPKTDDPYSFEASSDSGERFAWSGNVVVDPLQSRGSFKVAGLDLKKYSPYVSDFARCDVTDGKLDVRGEYQLSLGPDAMDLVVSKGSVQLARLEVKASDTGETVVSIPSLAVFLTEASLAKKTIQISAIKSSNGSLLVRQKKDGTINLLSMLKTSPPSAPPPAPATNETPWVAKVDQITFDNYAVHVEDEKPTKPAKLNIDRLAFTCDGFSTVSNTTVATTASLRLNEAGDVSVKGSVKLQPLNADLNLDLSGMDLRPFQPYVEDQVKLAITGGQLSVRGHATFPQISFTGDVGMTNFASTDLLHYQDFVKFAGLNVSGIQFALDPMSVAVQEVKVSGFHTSIIVDSNKQPNLLSIFPKKPASPAQTNAAPAPEFPITLGALVLENMSFRFADESIEPHCLFDIQELDGTIKGLTSKSDVSADVDIHGKVDEFSPFSVTGTISPLTTNISANVAISCKNTELTGFTPYMEKFAGYPLTKGKLMVDLSYDIVHRKLNASNKIVIANLTLGSKNNSPDATHLPVKLGIALLKDRSGKIDLDVPLSGSLDDPSFRIAPLIWKVVVNILVKAATSPFSLLGAMFGGGEELSFVDYQPGHSDIAPDQSAKLEKLSKALYERPSLSLEIAGSANAATDGPALAHAKLVGQIRALRAQELAAAGQLDAIFELDPTNYARLLKKLYVQTFGMPSNTTAAAEAPWTDVGHLPVATNKPAAVAARQPSSLERGAEALRDRSGFVKRAAPAPKPAAAAVTTTATATPSAEPTPEEMEAKLAAGIQITDNDLRALMQARAHSVQAALLGSGKVEGERIFILAPKSGTNTVGETRANLSLE